jgi:hypothetical protein
MTIVYLAGSISNGETATPEQIKRNIEKARKVAKRLWEIPDVYVICQHLNATFDKINKTYADWIKLDLEFLNSVDVVFMLPGWEKSNGATAEYSYAKKHKIPVVANVDIEKGIRNLEEGIAFSFPCRCCKRIRIMDSAINHYCDDCQETYEQFCREFKAEQLINFIPIPRNP